MSTQERTEAQANSSTEQQPPADGADQKLPVSLVPLWFLLALAAVVAYGALTK